MAKKEFSSLQIFIILTAIALASAGILAFVNAVTKKPIDNAEATKKREALTMVLPASVEKIEPKIFNYKGADVEINVGLDKSGKPAGYAFESITDKGFSGKILFLVGVDVNGNISGYKVLEHKETPGLGDNIKGEKFSAQFKGKGLSNFKFKVTKDGGDVQAITAATISSRATADALQKGLELFAEYKKSNP